MNTENDPVVQQHVHVNGNGNVINVAARDINGAPPQVILPPNPPQRSTTRASYRRLGTYATGGLGFIASLVFAITQISPSIGWPEGKTALCRDGWYSASHHRPGTCSSHRGVERWRFAANDPFWRQ
ncbi:MAG: DUF3761 domain-containing protein [Longimicrobiaceae bacterium]